MTKIKPICKNCKYWSLKYCDGYGICRRLNSKKAQECYLPNHDRTFEISVVTGKSFGCIFLRV